MSQSVRFDNQDLEIRSYVSSFSDLVYALSLIFFTKSMLSMINDMDSRDLRFF